MGIGEAFYFAKELTRGNLPIEGAKLNFFFVTSRGVKADGKIIF